MNKTYCVLCVLAGCLVWNATAQMADTVDKDMRMGPDYSYHSPTSQIPRQFQTDSAFHQGVPPPPAFSTRSATPLGAKPSQTQGGFIRSLTIPDEAHPSPSQPVESDGFLARQNPSRSVQKANTPSNPFDLGPTPDGQSSDLNYSAGVPSVKSLPAAETKKPSTSILSRLRFKSPESEQPQDLSKPASPTVETKRLTPLSRAAASNDDRRNRRLPVAPASSSVETAVGTPTALKDGLSRLLPGYDQPAASPSQVRVEFQSAREKIRQSLQQDQSNGLENEIGSMRDNAASMRGRLRNLPIEQRLKVGSISHMYDEAAGLIQEGRSSGEESKVRMGLERMDHATRQLDNLSE